MRMLEAHENTQTPPRAYESEVEELAGNRTATRDASRITKRTFLVLVFSPTFVQGPHS